MTAKGRLRTTGQLLHWQPKLSFRLPIRLPQNEEPDRLRQHLSRDVTPTRVTRQIALELGEATQMHLSGDRFRCFWLPQVTPTRYPKPSPCGRR